MKLAIFGGKKTITSDLDPYVSLGEVERAAVNRVIDSGSLSAFYGSYGDQFLGGYEVRSLEDEWSSFFDVKHSISVNSNTSGLIAAMGALGVSPGDEIIVPPLSMSATAMAPLFYGGIPVFADVEENTFCINPASVQKLVNKRTKGIIAVNLFGHPAKLAELSKIAKKNNIFLVEDNAQAPIASEYGKFTGTVGDIGVFSLNYHKHIHSGEGGVCVTNNDDLAIRLQAIRNHAENIVEPGGIKDLSNMIGYNFRMTELSAAIARTQLEKINTEVEKRIQIAEYLSKRFEGHPKLVVPKVRDNCRHVYYVWMAKAKGLPGSLSRGKLVEAILAEGAPFYPGYAPPLYTLPVFKEKIAIGSQGWPFNITNQTYYSNLCPVAEAISEEFIMFETCAFELSQSDVCLIGDALEKVLENLGEFDV